VRVVLKVHRKGIIVLPKKLREVLGVGEGDSVIAEVVEDKVVIRALKPRVVDVNPEVVEEILGEEHRVEVVKYKRMISSGEHSSRY